MKRLIFVVVIILIILSTRQPTNAAGGGWFLDTGYFQVSKVCRDGYLFTRASVALGQANYNSILSFKSTAHGPFTAKLTEEMADENGVIVGNELLLATHYYSKLGPTASISESQIEEVQNYEILGITQDRFVAKDILGYFYNELAVGTQVRFYGFILPVEDCHLAGINSKIDNAIPKTRFGATNIAFPEDELIYQILDLPSNGLANNVPLNIGDKLKLSEIPENGLTYTVANEPESEVEFLHYKVQGTTRVSVQADGGQAVGGDSREPSISAAGFDVAFTSNATNLNNSHNVGFSDIFVRRRFSEETTLISYEQNNGAGGDSRSPDISADGFRIVYSSAAQNLLSNDATCLEKADDNTVEDIFLYGNGATKRVSLFKPDGSPCQQFTNASEKPTIADTTYGQSHVVFETDEPLELPFFDDENDGSDLLLNRGINSIDNEPVYGINNLVIAPGPGVTPTLDMPNDRSYQPQISADGKAIAFASHATDLIRTFSGNPADTNGVSDIYVTEWNGSRWAVSRVSVTSDGTQTTDGGSAEPSISQFGKHIAFSSTADNLDKRANDQVQIYVRDRTAECTTLLSVNNDGEIGSIASFNPSISANGRYVAFYSFAANLVDGDTNGVSDAFVVDRDADDDGSFYTDPENCVAGPSSIVRVSVASDGTQANGASYDPDISGNGSFIAFTSQATNLVENDTNENSDVFVHYLGFEGKIRFVAEDHTIYLPLVVR